MTRMSFTSRQGFKGVKPVALQELRALWLSGKALGLIILYSIAMGVFTFLLATNYELSLIPAKEMVMLVIKMASAFALFTCLVAAATTISAERDRGTLESLLLTPISRNGLVLGKYLAVFSLWPAIFVVTLPYLVILAPDMGTLLVAILALLTLVTLLVLLTIGFGVIVSVRTGSNSASIAIALLTFVIVLLPTQLPGSMQTGAVGKLIKHVSPMESTVHFVEKILVNNRGIGEVASYLISPIFGTLAILAYLFLVEAPRLNLTGGRNTVERSGVSILPAPATIAVLLMAAILAISGAPVEAADAKLKIEIDTSVFEAKTGDRISFVSRLTNQGNETTGPFLLAMNLVDYTNGAQIDPEDWTPNLTRTVAPLKPGSNVAQTWNLHAILDGDYLAYVAVLPMNAPTGATPTLRLSPSARILIHPFARLNPQGVIPVIFGVPLLLMATAIALGRLQKRSRNGV